MILQIYSSWNVHLVAKRSNCNGVVLLLYKFKQKSRIKEDKHVFKIEDEKHKWTRERLENSEQEDVRASMWAHVHCHREVHQVSQFSDAKKLLWAKDWFMIGIFNYFLRDGKMRFHHISLAGLQLLSSSDPSPKYQDEKRKFSFTKWLHGKKNDHIYKG